MLVLSIFSPDNVAPEGSVQPAQSLSTESYSSYPSLYLPAQPVVDDQEAIRTSSRSKKVTKFFGDQLRHSIKTVEEVTQLEGEAGDLPSQYVLPSSQSTKWMPLIRDRSHLASPEASFSPSFEKTQDGN